MEFFQACLHFDNSGKCEAYCPPEMVYNPKTFQMEPNPDVKYAYGSKCVEECPGMSVTIQGLFVKTITCLYIYHVK